MEFLNVGRVQDAFGIRGELYVSLREAKPEWLKGLQLLRLKKGEVSEFKIVKGPRVHKHGFVVKVEGIDDRTAAERWIGAEFSIPRQLIVAPPGETPYLGEVIGFELWLPDAPARQGLVKAFTFNGLQDLLVVALDQGGEVEIPFVEEWVISLDSGARRLLMKMPAEFLDPQFWKA